MVFPEAYTQVGTVTPKQLPLFCALLQAHECCAADETFEDGGVHVDMRCLLYRTDEMYNEHPEATLNRAKMCTFLHHEMLSAAYTTMAADDELEVVLAHAADAEEFPEHSAVADMMHVSLEDQYEVTLATAAMHAIQQSTDATKFAP